MEKYAHNQRTWICTMDLENTQASYSKCLQLILRLEDIGKSDIRGGLEYKGCFMPFRISNKSLTGFGSVVALKKLESFFLDRNSRQYSSITSEEMLLSGLKKSAKHHEFCYYLRVHMQDDESDVADLQYLLLLLQSAPGIQERVSIRLMESDNAGWKEGDYFRVSHYLQFVQKQYRCFYACYNDTIGSLKRLQDDASFAQKTFLPLLEIDAGACQVLNRTWKVKIEYSDQEYRRLYQAVMPIDEDESSLAYRLFQIGTRFLFTQLSGRKYGRRDSKIELLKMVEQLIGEIHGITPLDMLLLGALGCGIVDGELDYNVLKMDVGRIQTLSRSVSQILENIVNHSQRNRGVFTFRIQKNKQYLKLHYPGFVIGNGQKGCLELLVGDSNTKDSIVSHFMASSKADSCLKEYQGSIMLSHLFGDYESRESEEVWQTARSKNPAMCHGLLSFAEGVKELGGAYLVRSSSDFAEQDKNETYYCCGEENKEYSYSGDYCIPGTQFSVVLNRPLAGNIRMKTDDEWAFDFDRLVYATNYKELALALDFYEKVQFLDIEDILAVLTKKELSGQEDKDTLVMCCQNWFNEKALPTIAETEHKLVYQCNLEPLCNLLSERPEVGEPFCKGFLSSRFFINANPDIYYAIILQNPSPRFSQIFLGTAQAIMDQDSFRTDHTCVCFYPKRNRDNSLPYYASSMHEQIGRKLNMAVFPRVFPYSLFIRNAQGQTMFEEEMLIQASRPITDQNRQGFKLSDTHMRLGNKVHLDAFYEMSLFFENPNYAYYTAFAFLQRLLSGKPEILRKSRKIIFYGYASYSRSVIWAILQILNEYRMMMESNQFPETAFVIYQNDLKAESDEPQAQMYYSVAEWQRNPKNIWKAEETDLIMVVPISSSLTTFNKMKAELDRETGQVFREAENFTALWVRNRYEDVCCPTKEEKYFWDAVNPVTRTIYSPLTNNEIHYMVSVISNWSNPLECKKCFPDDPLFELPLVETDATSTIPTQQLYLDKNVSTETAMTEAEISENDQRVARLKNNMAYGHIVKGANHFQYFVKTRVYFQQERSEIEHWLRSLRDKEMASGSTAFSSPECINILVIPQQTNNVEFGQYVYEYYFEGCAESIVINTEKEFRSNLNAEYSGLFQQLSHIKNPEQNIKFYYADMSITSGNGFSRVISLLAACMQSVVKRTDYVFRFEKIFLMVNRLSADSKRSYVLAPEKNFHSYVNINISSMRTFGDSCVPCKLQQEAKRYFSKASTKSVSSYWEQKAYDRKCCSFDRLEALDDKQQEEGYKRMICSHRIAHFLNPVKGADLPEYFAAVRSFLDEIRTAGMGDRPCGIYVDIDAKNRKDWYSAALKVLARPFLSFDYKMRCVVMDLFLVLSEHLIGGADYGQLQGRLNKICEDYKNNKTYLLKDGNLEWILQFAESLENVVGPDQWELLEFIRNNILKGLTDIKSNYIIRKKSIIQLSKRLGDVLSGKSETEISKLASDFYSHYQRSILRITHSSSDETKSVWLEYLLQYGEEYDSDNMKRNASERCGIEKLIACVPVEVRKEFREFMELLLIENNRPLYQAIMEVRKNSEQTDAKRFDSREVEKFLNGEYHMRNASLFLSMGDESTVYLEQLILLSELSKFLDETNHNIDGYERLRTYIQGIVDKECEVGADKHEVVLFGKDVERAGESEYLDLPEYFVISPSEMQGVAEKKDENAPWTKIDWDAGMGYMQKNGYYLQNINSEDMYNVVLLLDNNYEDMRKKFGATVSGQKIESVYVYIPCALNYQKALGLTRKLLIFRKRLIKWLEKDFNNNAIAQLSRQKYISRLLSTDKIGDHAEKDFIACEQELLMTVTKEEYESRENWKYAASRNGDEKEVYEDSVYSDDSPTVSDVLPEEREWFFLRSYINSRISRMFRAIAREEEWGKSSETDEIRYFTAENQSVMLGLAHNMKTVFFTPVKDGLNRKNYLRQMLRCITISVEGTPDFGDDPNADVETRLSNLENLFEKYDFVAIEKGNTIYGYKAEYLVVILLDCFVSAVKAGDAWNRSEWGGLAFKKLITLPASKKCSVRMEKETGKIAFDGYGYDYLVIRNNVFPNRKKKKGLGMSQKSIRWYIEKFWRNVAAGKADNDELPKVQMYEVEGDDGISEYCVKLPILQMEVQDE